ncbi:MAG: aldo/keto reductase [Phycisphaerales bacterium]|nr:aldo/keto reductase [Phycisphaerales bacterium]
MLKRVLGKTGLEVSVLGLGTVKLGRKEQVKYPHKFEIPDDAAASGLIVVAEECGINVIDTAPAYGYSEERLGKLLAGRRERWCIVTKVGEDFDGGVSRFDFSGSEVRGSVERSLRRLRTDRVEVVLVHSDGVVEKGMTEGLWGELERLKGEGKVRGIGVSVKTAEGFASCIARSDVLMVEVDPADSGLLVRLAEAQRRGVGILAKKALSSGHAADPGASLRGVLGVPGVSCAVVGTINPGHLRANCLSVAGVR